MKKLIVALALAAAAVSVFAGPHSCGPCPGGWGPRPCGPDWGPGPCMPCRPGWHGPGWGRGGCNFWPGFAAGAAGALVGNVISGIVAPRPTYVVQHPAVNPIVTAPAVSQPVIVQQPVVQQVIRQPVVVTQPYVRPAYTSEMVIGTPGTVVTTIVR